MEKRKRPLLDELHNVHSEIVLRVQRAQGVLHNLKHGIAEDALPKDRVLSLLAEVDAHLAELNV